MTRFPLRFSLAQWLRKLLARPSRPARRRSEKQRPLLLVEVLEDRLAPASLTDSFSTLTINLDIPGEALTISGTGSSHYAVSSTQPLLNAGLTGATYSATNADSGTLTLTTDTSINIVDLVPGTSVQFGNGNANPYDFSQFISVNLSNPLSGNVVFAGPASGSGSLTFENGVSVTTQNGSITEASTETVTVNNSNDLDLTANEGTITLNGAVNVSGATSLEAAGAISASNSNNVFTGELTLTGPGGNPGTNSSATVVSSGALELNEVILAGALNVTAGGDITESDSISVGSTATFSTGSSGGSIDLHNDNVFGGDFNATVTGSADVTAYYYNSTYYENASTFEIGTISMGTGNLTLANESYGYDYNQDIAEDPSAGGISTGGNVQIDLYYDTQDVLLGNAANNIAGSVSVSASYAYGNFTLTNTNASAAIGNLSFSGYEINSLTLDFPNATIGTADWDNLVLLPVQNYEFPFDSNVSSTVDVPEFDNLSLTAKSITEDPSAFLSGFTYYEAVATTGTASFTATTGGITVGNQFNDFQGAVSAALTGATNTNSIQIDNSDQNVTLGNIALQKGSLTLNDWYDPASPTTVSQAEGTAISTASGSTGTITVNIENDAAANVELTSATNDIVSGVTVDINGASSTGNFGYSSDATGASLNQVTFTNFTIDALTVDLSGNVDIGDLYTGTLPLATLGTYTDLTVTASGNITDGEAITVTGDLTLNAGGDISFSTVALTVGGDADFSADGDISLSELVTIDGAATFSAGTTISDSVALTVNGDAAFSTTGNVAVDTDSIDLADPSNVIPDVSLKTPASDPGNVSFVTTGALTLESSSVGTGILSVSAGGEISEHAGSTISALGQGVDDVQTVMVTATGGTFTLKFGADTTGNIAFNATTATVQTDLENLGDIGNGNVQVTGTPGDYIVTFTGTLADSPQSVMSVNTGSLTGGSASVAHTTTGVTGATFTASGATEIDLGTPTDSDANFFAGPITFAGADLTTVYVEDQNTTATLGSFTVPSGILFNLTLDFDTADGNPVAGFVLPNLSPGNFLPYSLTLTTATNIVLPSGSAFGLTGSNNLKLISEDGDINLFGQLSVGGTTTLETESETDAANNIIANNPANAFGTLDLTSDSFTAGGAITIVSAGSLVFGTSSIESADLTATANAGTITQTGAISSGSQADLDFITEGVDDVQTVAVNATGGTFNLTFGADTATGIAFNAPIATVQTDLANLASIGAGNVLVTGTAGNYTVTFVDSLADAPQSVMTANSAGLTGGTHTATVTHTTTGVGGAIDLANAANSFAGPVSASTDVSNTAGTGRDGVTLASSNTITLGTINPGDGALTVTAANGISESAAFGGISLTAGSSATLAFTVSGSSAGINLGAAQNNIPGTALVSITGGVSTTANLAFDDANPGASLSIVSLTSFHVQNLSITLDNSSINFTTATAIFAALPATGSLSLTAGGNITQSSPIITSGNASFDLESGGSNGDGSIILTNPANAITGSVSFSAPNADNKQQISLVNSGSIDLGSSELGLAGFTLTANNNGNILEQADAAVTQDRGGGPIAMNATGGTVNLGAAYDDANEFTGPVTLASGTDDVQTVTVNATGGTFTLTFNAKTTAAIAFNAPIATVQADLAALSTIGAGNVQVTGTPGAYTVTFVGALADAPQNVMTATSTGLTGGTHTATVVHTTTGVSNLATVGFGNQDVLATLPRLIGAVPVLTSATFDLTNATIALPTIHAGTLNVNAGGNIDQLTGASLNITGEATFTAGDYGILLSNTGNNINEISLNNSGENAISVATTGSITIDNSEIGSGPLTIHAGGGITETSFGGIDEVLGSNDTVAGAITLSAGAGSPILLDNVDNGLLGPINLNTSGTGGNATIYDNVSAILGADAVGGALSVTANGSITQAAGTFFTVAGGATYGAYFSAAEEITLANPGNSIASGATSINAGGNGATLAVTGAIKLANSTVSGPLNLTAGGSINQSPGGVITAEGGSITSTTGSITLTNSGNDFGGDPISLSAPQGSVSLADNDIDGLDLNQVTFGSAGLTLSAAGNIVGYGVITGSGSVTITNNSANPISVDLANIANNITGTGQFDLSNFGQFGDVSITNLGNIDLSVSTLTSSSVVDLIAGGTVTLPSGNLTIGNLTVFANKTVFSSDAGIDYVITDVNLGGTAISFTGEVQFTGPVTLDASGDTNNTEISFDGNVTTAGSITVDLPSAGSLVLAGGTWTQSAGYNLTINGTSATVDVESGATLDVAGGDTVTVSGEPKGGGAPSTGNVINVQGTLQIGGAVTVSDGGSDSIITVNFTGTLLDSLGATVGTVTLGSATANASDQIDIGDTAILSGFGGLAPAASTVIAQVLGGGIIQGSGSNPANQLGEFLMGTDIVTATQTATSLSIQEATTGATPLTTAIAKTATVVANEPDGDKFTVTATDGVAGLSLMVIAVGQPYAGLDIVVRGANAATTLTVVTTANGGDGFTLINGIAVDGLTTAATTISAATSNVLNGNIVTAGPLTSLSLRNWNNGVLQAGGTAAGLTSITGAIFNDVDMTLGTKLNSLTVAADNGGPTISAASFGTITASGNAATLGNFSADLVDSATPPAGVALTSATVSGTLSGQWDLAGSVGTVTVGTTATATKPDIGRTTNWALGVPNGPFVANAGLLTNVSSLTLGTVVNGTIFASGNVGTLTAVSVNDAEANNTLQANSFGTITTTGQPVNLPLGAGDHGNFVANVTATGNAGGLTKNALGALNVAGDLGLGSPSINLLFMNGNVGSISVGEEVDCANIDAVTGVGVGNIGTATTGITAAAWQGSYLDANNVSTWKVIGDLSADIFGFFDSNTVTLTGALTSFSATENVASNTFTVEGGSVGSFTVGATMSSTFITLTSTAPTTTLGTITAAEWQGDSVIARTIGTLKSTGRLAALADTGALNGDINDTSITAFAPVGQSAVGIGTFSAAGEVNNASPEAIIANNGITSFTVVRDVTNVQLSTDLNGIGGLGGITTLTVGSWANSDLAAAFVGTFNVTAYATPELTGAIVLGDVTNSNFIINGSSSTTHNSIGSMSVQHNLGGTINNDTVFLNVPFGIGTLAVGGAILGEGTPNPDTVIDARNPVTPANGAIGTITTGEVQNTDIYADEITGVTGINVTGNLTQGLNGDFANSTLAVASFSGLATAPVGVTSFTLAGNLGGTESPSLVEVADGVTTLSVAQSAAQSGIVVGFDPVNTNATLKTLNLGTADHIRLTASSIGTFNVTGNGNFGLAGDIKNSSVAITGNLAGVGLGTFTAAGHVQNVSFHVTSGNVTAFKTGYFIGSGLFVGYTPVDPLAINDVVNNGQGANWEGTFTLGSFTTTAVLNNANSAFTQATAGFQTSDVVAGKLGVVAISGLEPNGPPSSDLAGFGFGFRTTGGVPASTFTVTGVTEHAGVNPLVGDFFYVGLTG